MKIAIVHCHFRSGGVTQVVQNHVASLHGDDAIEEILLVSGDRLEGLSEQTKTLAKCLTLGALDYDELHQAIPQPVQPPSAELSRKRVGKAFVPVDQSPQDATATASIGGQELFDELTELFTQNGLHRGNTVIHWHNHSLGKNAAAPHAIGHLANAGWKLCLQIHDFAEDQRPENYAAIVRRNGVKRSESLDRILYPLHPNISYACLSSGDTKALRTWGIPKTRVAVLPNSVRLPDSSLPSRDEAMQKISRAFQIDVASRWILYPVRGIRRKNVGEFLLLVGLLSKRHVGALTLRPDTPLEAESYDRWNTIAKEHFCNENSSRVLFDVAHHADIHFVDNLAACHCVLSTSVAEGFGMAFLEPWLAGRNVIARNLPGVTSDFQDAGVRLPGLYDSVAVPGNRDWIATAMDEWRTSRDSAWAKIPQPMRPATLPSDHADDGNTIDFAMLMPQRQIEVVVRSRTDEHFRAELIQHNQSIIEAITADPDDTLIDHNASVISTQYAAKVQREQLLELYQSKRKLESTDMSPQRDGNARMIDLIDAAHPFYPCRVERPIVSA